MFACKAGKAEVPKRHRGVDYATNKEFQEIFTENMAGLHLLALLLTGDQALAEQCFVKGLQDSIHGNPVFREWARAWSRRAIIKRAIASVRLTPDDNLFASAVAHGSTGNDLADQLIATLLRLPVFQRFVYVISVLEGYSLPECSALLGRSGPEIIKARSAALQQVAATLPASVLEPQESRSWWKSVFSRSDSPANSIPA